MEEEFEVVAELGEAGHFEVEAEGGVGEGVEGGDGEGVVSPIAEDGAEVVEDAAVVLDDDGAGNGCGAEFVCAGEVLREDEPAVVVDVFVGRAGVAEGIEEEHGWCVGGDFAGAECFGIKPDGADDASCVDEVAVLVANRGVEEWDWLVASRGELQGALDADDAREVEDEGGAGGGFWECVERERGDCGDLARDLFRGLLLGREECLREERGFGPWGPRAFARGPCAKHA